MLQAFITKNQTKHLPMATINPKEEVLKVYPDAVCGWDYNVNQTHAIRYWIKNGDKLLSEKFSTSLLSWQNAYDNNIKNQNNI